MPRYVYKFPDETYAERVQSIHDAPFVAMVHPKTGRYEPVKRVPQSPVAKFRGTGWARG